MNESVLSHILNVGRFLGITAWDHGVCKSNRLHVDILWFSFIKLGYIPKVSLKWSVIFLQSWTSTGFSSNTTGSSVTNCRFSPIIDCGLSGTESCKECYQITLWVMARSWVFQLWCGKSLSTMSHKELHYIHPSTRTHLLTLTAIAIRTQDIQESSSTSHTKPISLN